MILDLYNKKDKYVVIDIDAITGIKGFVKDSLLRLKDGNGKRLDSATCFKIILSFCLEDRIHYPANRVLSTNHIDYFTNYLRYYDSEVGFHARTIIVEKEYMSLSFLKDFSKYYSIGYTSYSKYCKRIHFFQNKISPEEFESFINTNDEENSTIVKDIKAHYLGHIVAKPLPNSLIGATLLRPYDEFFHSLKENGYPIAPIYAERNRNFSALKKYDVNLFGQTISFKSLVFQEQDRAVSACATVAIWMALHKINELFRTPIPAPSEITESAGLGTDSGRNIPNQGLSLEQIIRAIDNVQKNLVSEIFVAKDIELVAIARKIVKYKIIKPWKIKRYIYAYLRLQIPILLGYNFNRLDGNHLVTITGYRFEKNDDERQLIEERAINSSETPIKTVADKIIRLYSHDDQLGPFSKIGFDHDGFSNYLKVNWRNKDKYELAVPQLVVVPIIDFIRIRYSDIELFATQFQEFLGKGIFKRATADKIRNMLVWDIYVIQSNDYKVQLRNTKDEIVNKSKLQAISYPQYIWVASLRTSNSQESKVVYDFIFDATDTPKSMNLFDVIYYNTHGKKTLLKFIKKMSPKSLKDTTKDIFHGMRYLTRIKETLNRR